MDQWHSARAQSSPDSPRCSPDASRQVAAGMECAGKANAARGHFWKAAPSQLKQAWVFEKLAPLCSICNHY